MAQGPATQGFNPAHLRAALEIARRAHMLHMFVHGHAFLEIDGKNDFDLTPDQEHGLMVDIAARIMRD